MRPASAEHSPGEQETSRDGLGANIGYEFYMSANNVAIDMLGHIRGQVASSSMHGLFGHRSDCMYRRVISSAEACIVCGGQHK